MEITTLVDNVLDGLLAGSERNLGGLHSVVLGHGHFDHAGGLARLRGIRK
ncbi:MBL fold metallo-hydrolase [Amycolatopsis taiwanensis]|uniref:Metallo-beta-lactamase domain-containing protein n=1 Tax=Amycolatopsis taiwanensis TaxID=342230 RepID=A0A9W6R8L3_9PSEU|nr:MBL fold metallo-hydrolase [Amycolatopsis taiwanensis]GLY71161.1 hypothetical protein Atai01_77800 [Amycolatopsis taiwanensis]